MKWDTESLAGYETGVSAKSQNNSGRQLNAIEYDLNQ